MTFEVRNLRGAARVTVYLDRVTSDNVEQVVDDLADVVAARGLGNSEDKESQVRSLIVADGQRFPRSGWRVRRLLRRASLMVLPMEDRS